MPQKRYVQSQIERCLRLAQQVDDAVTQQRLLKLADDYRAKATAPDTAMPERDDIATADISALG